LFTTLQRLSLRIVPLTWNSLRAWLSASLLLLSLGIFPQPADADWSSLTERLVNDGFEEKEIRELFSRSEVKFDPGPMATKLKGLIKKPSARVAANSARNSRTVHKSFLRGKVIARARTYVEENNLLLENIRENYGVPKEILVSILLLETRLGEYVGGPRAFNRLASMALHPDLAGLLPYLPQKLIHERNESLARSLCRQKADWAYDELKALMGYAMKSGLDPLNIPGSVYGAIGLCQFMPSNALSYGVDADLNGRIDLFAKEDALHSMANYLRGHGWQGRMDRKAQHKVIYAYNHSAIYVNTVLAVADRLKEKSRPGKGKARS